MAYLADRYRDRERLRPDGAGHALAVRDGDGNLVGRAHGGVWPALTDLGIVPEATWVIYLGDDREPVPGLWVLRAGRFVELGEA